MVLKKSFFAGSRGLGGLAGLALSASMMVVMVLAGCESKGGNNFGVPVVQDGIPATQPGLPVAVSAPEDSVAEPAEIELKPKADKETDPPAPLALDPVAMQAEQGFVWIVSLPPEWAAFSSDTTDGNRSRLRLTEDGKLLGFENSPHQSIREHGGGAHSHWGSVLYFSSSDGSNPQTNGRSYVISIAKLD